MRVAIVGGGLGGLAAGHALVAAGIDAHVIEASQRAGGVVGTSRIDGFVREHAASSFVGGPPHGAVALCDALGVELERASPRAKRRWIYIDGALRALPQGPLEFIRSDLLTWRGKLDLLREPLRPARDRDESVHAFAARRFGAEAARAIVAPFVTGVFAADAHDISIEAGFPRLATLDAGGGIALGLARQATRGVVARVAGRRSDATRRGLWAPRGGLGAMIDALATKLGDRVRIGAPVDRIVPIAGGVVVDGERWDGVVLAIPAEDAVSIVAVPELATRLGEFRRAATSIVYLGFPDDAVACAADGFGALVAIGEDVRVLGIVFESTVRSGRSRPNHTLLRCIFGGGRDPQAATLDDAALIAQATRDAGVVIGARGSPVHASVVRWRRGIAQYRVGHRDRVRAAATSARAHRIALAGADYYGPAINDLCADTARIVEEVRAW